MQQGRGEFIKHAGNVEISASSTGGLLALTWSAFVLSRPVADQADRDYLQSIYEREHKHLELQGRKGFRRTQAPLVASRPWMERTLARRDVKA